MPNVGFFDQYTIEKMDYLLGFARKTLADAETILSIVNGYPTVSPTGPTVTAAIVDDLRTDDAIQVWLDNPTNGITYTIVVLATTSGGREVAGVIKVAVQAPG